MSKFIVGVVLFGAILTGQAVANDEPHTPVNVCIGDDKCITSAPDAKEAQPEKGSLGVQFLMGGEG